MSHTTSSPDTAQAGFTIVELMIATVVFSLILIVITMGVLSFTNSYYKGVNSSNVQTTTQSAIDTISQAIQFNGTSISQSTPGSKGIVCVGSQQFSYNLGKEVASNNTGDHATWGLYQSTGSGTCTAGSVPVTTGGKELLGPSMRLTEFSVTNVPNTNLWQVKVSVALGDHDLLYGVSGDFYGGIPSPTAVYGSDISCQPHTGSQFCAVSKLSGTVAQRIVNN